MLSELLELSGETTDMSKTNPLFNKEYILLLSLVTAAVLSFSHLSEFGFMVSEHLAKSPRLNYGLSVILIFFGITDLYRRLRLKEFSSIRDALKAYIAFGVAMAGVYYLIFRSHEGCYLFPDDIANSPTILDFLYFSFVTVTTVGYGDIVPQHTFVRVLVLLQILLGLTLALKATPRCSN